MAASGAEKYASLDKAIADSKVILSAYADSLESNVKRRYVEKISVIGMDPLLVPLQKFTTECLPPVETPDIFSYLVLDTSYYSKDHFKNFRSLQAYNQMVSGFITSVLGQIIQEKFVVLAKVRHSQRMNDPHVQLWIITTKDGTVVSAHCAGCMAGLGECCSHIASVLFYLEVWTRLNGKLACTQVKCTWLLPSAVKHLEYARVEDINFSSAKKLKSDLDKSIESVNSSNIEPSAAAQIPEHTPAENKSAVKRPLEEKLQAFYKSLSECIIKPVGLSLIPPYSESFISKTRDIKSIPDLYEKKYLDLPYTELLKECYKVDLELTDEQINTIERDTIDQAKGGAFFRHRAGRIGASKCRAASHTDLSQPSQSLIKAICYPNIFRFSTAATKHGCKHEAQAIAAYEETMKETHANFVVTRCGTIINKKYPFLHATPDFLCECDCCGQGCGEVKCPFCIEGLDFDSYVKMKASCLEKQGDEFVLKKDHDYYYQSQQQIHTAGRAYLDFIVFATDGTSHRFVKQRLLPDIEHWEKQIPKLETFWRICVLPEILGHWYTRKMDLKSQIGPKESWPSGDCYCRQSTNEKTITCANPECKVSSFHPSCLCIDKLKVPKVWYCPHCRKLPQFVRQKSKKVTDMKDEYLTEAANLDKICTCQKKAEPDAKLLKCHNQLCSSGKFFHLTCMSYKRYPSNAKTTWVCNNCKISMPKSRPSTLNTESGPWTPSPITKSRPSTPNTESGPSTSTPITKSRPSTPNTKSGPSTPNTESGPSTSTPITKSRPSTPTTVSEPSASSPIGSQTLTTDPEVEFIGATINFNVNKTGSLGSLTDWHFALIANPRGWFDGTIIHQAQICLKKINPNIEGFQRPTLGLCNNFDVVGGEFVQLLHTGGNHWVCLSSIGCPKGQVNLYDSFFHDVICDDIEQQAQDLLGDEFRKLSVVPVHQQLNGSDCGVFSIAFATSLVFMDDPKIMQYDIPKMRGHLIKCLKSGQMEQFPAIPLP